MGNLIGNVFTVLLKPGAALKNLSDEGEGAGIISSLIFIAVLSVVSGLIASLIGMFIPPLPVTQGVFGKGGMWLLYMVVGPLLILAGSFASAFFLWGITDGFFKGTLPQYKLTYRLLALTAAFYPLSALISPIPKIGVYLGYALQAWVLIFVLWGLISVKNAKPLQTILILVISGVLLALAAIFGPRIGQNLGIGSTLPSLGGAVSPEVLPGETQGMDQIDKMMQEEAGKGQAQPPSQGTQK